MSTTTVETFKSFNRFTEERMIRTRNNSREYKAYRLLQHWKPVTNVLPARELMNSKAQLYSLFLYIYNRTKGVYAKLPLRKNGEQAFIHPINLVLALKEANVNDQITLCAGLIHDVIEEKVDEYKRKKNIKEDKKGIKILDKFEDNVCERARKELETVCKENGIPLKVSDELIAITRLLTRHKRDFYYRSICNIFMCHNPVLKRKAITVKLADRMHNILSIECFNTGLWHIKMLHIDRK